MFSDGHSRSQLGDFFHFWGFSFTESGCFEWKQIQVTDLQGARFPIVVGLVVTKEGLLAHMVREILFRKKFEAVDQPLLHALASQLALPGEGERTIFTAPHGAAEGVVLRYDCSGGFVVETASIPVRFDTKDWVVFKSLGISSSDLLRVLEKDSSSQ